MIDEWVDNETAYSEKQIKTALENHYNVKMIIHETHVKT